MLYIIDGTGAEDNRTYSRDMSGGMCDRMARVFGGNYQRGPTLSGMNTFNIAEETYKNIKADKALGRQPLFLAGHSRGGAAVIRVAQWLKDDGIPVEAMFLFDAVDRTISLVDVQTVPKNVKKVFHARRDKKVADYFSVAAQNAVRDYVLSRQTYQRDPRICEQKRQIAAKYTRLDNAMKVRMRFSTGMFDGPSIDFGNCGIASEATSAEAYVEEFFLGSHGAIGGSFIGGQDGAWAKPTDSQFFAQILQADKAAVASVSAWMKDKFIRTNLKLHGGVRSEAAPTPPPVSPIPGIQMPSAPTEF